MFLFNKRTRNIIKYMWAVFAILIIFTMVIAYSGFTSLAQPTSQQVEIPPEIQEQLLNQQQGGQLGNTPEEQAILDAINSGEIELVPSDEETGDEVESETESLPETPQSSESFRLEV